MPVMSIPIGPPVSLVANQIYALPAVKVTMFTDTTSPTIQLSNTGVFTANVAVTLAAGGATLVGGWLRATGATSIILKRD